MKIIELILDEENEDNGITAISVVENPAIEEDFIALKNQEVKFAEQDKEKRILMGAALIPNKPIYRKNEEDEYYIFFSKETVRKASELFFIKGNQSESTLEHKVALEGLTVVESWIVESDKDKSRHYGMEVPVGTWMVSMKVNNDEVWNEYVKSGKVKGFSIEAYFSDKMSRPKDKTLNESLEDEANELLEELKDFLNKENLESYSDYPDAVANNAKRGIDLNEKNNNKCATQVGKVRAQQLAKKEAVTVETVKRMFSYLSRAEEYYDEGDTQACGTISYLLWGGKAGLRWAGSKLRELDLLEEDLKKPCQAGYEMIGFKMKNGRRVPNCVPLSEQKLETMVINKDFAIIDDRLAYSTQEKAEEMAKNIGCEGFHTHDLDGQTWFMPCQQHAMSEEEYLKYKCPPGFKKDYKTKKCVRK
tara:strand:- start:1805 stop:3061 length:1257 start_codon:yes stop_codon:yes gene_type:complete